MLTNKMLVHLFVVAFLIVCDSVHAQINSTCTTPKQEPGLCVSIKNCPSLLAQVASTDTKVIKFLRQSQCGYQKDPLVCCSSQDAYDQSSKKTTTTTTSAGTPSTVTTRSSLIPQRKNCGIQNLQEKVLGGEAANLDEFPWMALLEYKLPDGTYDFACGGSLISARYVLTAGHCAKGNITFNVGPLERVRLGEYDTDKEIDCLETRGFKDCNVPPVIEKIEKIIVHPDYDPNSADRQNDIALLRLEHEVKYTHFIRPICLPEPHETAAVKDGLFVAGWGKTEKASYSNIKLKLQVPIVELSNCVSTFKRAGVGLTDRQLCAGGESGKDSCNGDSGGPLMNTIPNNTAQWYIEGIVSFGAACGTPRWPGVYTRVNKYLDWIYKSVEP